MKIKNGSIYKTGAVQPAWAIVFSEVIGVFAICDRKEQATKISMYCLIFVAFGVLAFFSYFFQVKHELSDTIFWLKYP